jgi:hypothetical protein
VNPLTAREIFEYVRELRPRVQQSISAEAEITATLPRLRLERDEAKAELDRAEARAFLVAKSQKATDETAKRMARLDESVTKAERIYREKAEKVREATDRRELAHSETKAWGGIVEANSALSWALNRELKMEAAHVR